MGFMMNAYEMLFYFLLRTKSSRSVFSLPPFSTPNSGEGFVSNGVELKDVRNVDLLTLISQGKVVEFCYSTEFCDALSAAAPPNPHCQPPSSSLDRSKLKLLVQIADADLEDGDNDGADDRDADGQRVHVRSKFSPPGGGGAAPSSPRALPSLSPNLSRYCSLSLLFPLISLLPFEALSSLFGIPPVDSIAGWSRSSGLTA
ncbi:hypothetical protein RHMOL_Rhmol10G0058400 [Rhododendron molle]|uniref:Uncharacterized protein n=1 Tax=Rhododendron molle TaxID=49168 RepID=A0ACC0M0D0_RHOML|nr:hypothetical protein RHMOL_Rhmol10G0058400 [Rhododendron molle]